MEVSRSFNELGSVVAGAWSVTIGMFDGVHLGHQQILAQTLSFARHAECKALAIIFENHPDSYLRPEAAPKLIYPTDYKLELLEGFGLDHTLLLTFGAEISELAPEEFISQLFDLGIRIRAVFVGEDFRFGRSRLGDVRTLRDLGQRFGFETCAVAPVTKDGVVVSSTAIRRAISLGLFLDASNMLGRQYAIVGRVVPGKRLATELGFPTANLDVTGLVLPPPGVYFVKVRAPSGSRFGVANVGYRPTLHEKERTLSVEVHIFDFTGGLYGQRLEVAPLEFMRPELRFDSVESLRRQVELDVKHARRLIGKYADAEGM